MASARRSWSKLSSLVSAGFLSNHLGASISAAQPVPSRPSASRMRARTKHCGASVSVTTPKRNGMRSTTGRSKKSTSTKLKSGVSLLMPVPP